MQLFVSRHLLSIFPLDLPNIISSNLVLSHYTLGIVVSVWGASSCEEIIPLRRIKGDRCIIKLTGICVRYAQHVACMREEMRTKRYRRGTIKWNKF